MKTVRIVEVNNMEWKVMIDDFQFATFRGETARIDAMNCGDTLCKYKGDK